MYFQPTREQINAAQKLLIAKAFYQLLKTEHDRLTTEILQTGIFYYDDAYYDSSNKETANLPKDRILRNPDHLSMMLGYNDTYTRFSKNNSILAFNKAIGIRLTQAGYRFHECALPHAENTLINAEDHFLAITQSLDLPPCGYYSHKGKRSNRIDTLLAYFSSVDLWPFFHQRELTFFNDRRIIELTEQENYLANEVSFQKFLAYKRFIPIAEYLAAQNKSEAQDNYAGVTGLWAYVPHCFIYQIEPGNKWQGINQPFAIHELAGGYQATSSFADMERILYNDFIRYVD